MNDYTLDRFLAECRESIAKGQCPADYVEAIAPSMYKLLNGDQSFLRPEHYRTDPDHYARNAIYVDDNDEMSLFALTWLPGQWTPVHDHGTWGVVGVLEGTLEEQNFINTSQQPGRDDDVQLVRGGVILLSPGAVTSFVPNPDHIHITGNADKERRVVSLHLYGHAMAGFNIYDREAGTRNWVEVSYNES